MTENFITYGLLLFVGILAIVSFTIGIEKMIKVILGNYILSSICFAASQSITLAVQIMLKTPDVKFMGFTYDKIAKFLDN